MLKRSVLHEDDLSIQREETRLLRAMTIDESLRQWLILQTSFEQQLQQTAALFEQDRCKALAELQARLQKLAGWRSPE